MDKEEQLKRVDGEIKRFYNLIDVIGKITISISCLFVVILLCSCTTTDIIEQSKRDTVRQLREQCMNNMSNDPTPSPLLRTSALHNCHAWARSKVQ